MCTVTAITTESCPSSRAGISVLWATPCSDVATLTFDANHQITAITLIASPTEGFVKIEFEKDTAFLEQTKSRIKTNVNVTQTISFFEPGLSSTVRKALYDLNTCCCLHVIVRDNSGNYHYCGINFYPATDEWEDSDMRTGDGSANTGADPTADSAEFNETLTCTSNWYAPFWTLAEAGIPTI